MEISFLNNIKKYSSVNDKTGIANVMNEAFREAEKFKNNVNQNLTELNKVLIRNIDVLKQQYKETKVVKTSKDIMTVDSSIQTGDFEAAFPGGVRLNGRHFQRKTNVYRVIGIY